MLRRWPVFLYKLTNPSRLDSERMIICRSEAELQRALRAGWRPCDEFYQRLEELRTR